MPNQPSRLDALINLPLAARYGVEAAVWLAQAPADGFHPVEDVAARLSLPREFLAKVCRRLLRAGLFAARRGPGGGYRLASTPREIRVLRLLEAAVAGEPPVKRCVLFTRRCGENPCAAHEAVSGAEEQARRALASLTLADLAAEPTSLAHRRADGPASQPQAVPLTLVLAFALGAAACGSREMEVYRTAKRLAPAAEAMIAAVPEASMAPAAAPTPRAATMGSAAGLPPPADGGDLSWKAPSGWKSKPAGGMRLATFLVPTPRGQAELSVIVLAGDAGGDLANVNRWRGQLGLPAIDASALANSAKRVKSAAGSTLVVDLVGADGAAGMIGAILPKGEKTWFFKLTGAAKATSAAKPSLLQFLASLR